MASTGRYLCSLLLLTFLGLLLPESREAATLETIEKISRGSLNGKLSNRMRQSVRLRVRNALQSGQLKLKSTSVRASHRSYKDHIQTAEYFSFPPALAGKDVGQIWANNKDDGLPELALFAEKEVDGDGESKIFRLPVNLRHLPSNIVSQCDRRNSYWRGMIDPWKCLVNQTFSDRSASDNEGMICAQENMSASNCGMFKSEKSAPVRSLSDVIPTTRRIMLERAFMHLVGGTIYNYKMESNFGVLETCATTDPWREQCPVRKYLTDCCGMPGIAWGMSTDGYCFIHGPGSYPINVEDALPGDTRVVLQNSPIYPGDQRGCLPAGGYYGNSIATLTNVSETLPNSSDIFCEGEEDTIRGRHVQLIRKVYPASGGNDSVKLFVWQMGGGSAQPSATNITYNGRPKNKGADEYILRRQKIKSSTRTKCTEQGNACYEDDHYLANPYSTPLTESQQKALQDKYKFAPERLHIVGGKLVAHSAWIYCNEVSRSTYGACLTSSRGTQERFDGEHRDMAKWGWGAQKDAGST